MTDEQVQGMCAEVKDRLYEMTFKQAENLLGTLVCFYAYKLNKE